MIKLSRAVLLLFVLASVTLPAWAQKAASRKYKCMIQMTNYTGEEAYIVISLINPKGAYEKTLYVMGDDKEWHKDVKEWYAFHKKKPVNISAITGASVAGGNRSIKVIEIEDAKIDKGYTLRFETAVEDKEYRAKDIEVPLTTQNLSGKFDGKGYIRYVRFSPN